MSMMGISCRKASRLMSQGLDRKLGFVERVSLRVHLVICDGCHNFEKQITFLRRALRAAAEAGDGSAS